MRQWARSEAGGLSVNRGAPDDYRADSLAVRPASGEDVDFVIDLCRACLPDWRLLQGRRARARRWWESLISAEFCEVLIFTCGGARVGFCKLDKDIEAWETHRREFCPSAGDWLWAVVLNPLTCAAKCWRRLTMKHQYEVLRPDGTASTAGDRSVWLRPLAVVRQWQGKGLGSQMLRLICRKAADGGYQWLKLQVSSENRRAIRLYEKTGFVQTARGNGFFTYARETAKP